MLHFEGSLLTTVWHPEWMVEYHNRIKSRCGILEYRPEIKITETRSISCQMEGQRLNISRRIFYVINQTQFCMFLTLGCRLSDLQTIFCGLILWLCEIWHRTAWCVGGYQCLGAAYKFHIQSRISHREDGGNRPPKTLRSTCQNTSYLTQTITLHVLSTLRKSYSLICVK